MAKSKVKRYAKEGYVYEDDTPEEVANRSAESQAIMDEAKGESMLKSMRDEAVKPKVVTKEELAKSGLSLRDYLNKQQGLTRRGESSTSAPAAKSTPSTTTTSSSSSASSTPSTSPSIKKETYRTLSGEIKTKKSEAERDADMAARRAKVSGVFSDILKNREERLKRDKEMYGFAKGGSASSRADGIAKRGKTRGKIC